MQRGVRRALGPRIVPTDGRHDAEAISERGADGKENQLKQTGRNPYGQPCYPCAPLVLRGALLPYWVPLMKWISVRKMEVWTD